jgi:hypothetical protein
MTKRILDVLVPVAVDHAYSYRAPENAVKRRRLPRSSPFLAGLRSNFPSSRGGEFLGARLAAHAASSHSAVEPRFHSP